MDIQGHTRVKEALQASNVWAEITPTPRTAEQDVRFVTIKGEDMNGTQSADILNALGQLIVRPEADEQSSNTGPVFRIVSAGAGEVTLEDLNAPLFQAHTGPSIR